MRRVVWRWRIGWRMRFHTKFKRTHPTLTKSKLIRFQMESAGGTTTTAQSAKRAPTSTGQNTATGSTSSTSQANSGKKENSTKENASASGRSTRKTGVQTTRGSSTRLTCGTGKAPSTRVTGRWASKANGSLMSLWVDFTISTGCSHTPSNCADSRSYSNWAGSGPP